MYKQFSCLQGALGVALLAVLPGVALALDKPATAIPLTANTPYQDFLTQSGEVKWYTMSNTNGGKLTLQMNVSKLQNANYDLQLYRYDPATNSLVQQVDSNLPAGMNEQISKNAVLPATWYAAVKSTSGADSANPFTLNWFMSGAPDAREPDDSPAQASAFPYSVNTAAKIQGTHDHGEDWDWYKYTVPTAGLFKFMTSQGFDAVGKPLPHGNPTAEVYDKNFKLLTTVPPLKIVYDYPMLAGDYYIKVYSATKSAGFAYTLWAAAKAPVTAAKVAISNVSSEGGVQGFINYGQGQKWRVKGAIGISGKALDASGNPVPNAELAVEVRPKFNSTPVTANAISGADGSFTLNLSLPPAIGQYSYNNTISMHYYDIIPLSFKSAGKAITANIADFYHFAYQR